MKLTQINETLIEYQFANKISLAISEEIFKSYYYLLKNCDYQKLGLLDITPCFNSIAISYKSSSPLFNDPDYLRDDIIRGRDFPHKINNKTHIIEISYNGLDLDEVCLLLKLTKKEFIHVHQKNTYTIAMLGFKGNFPYLLGLDKRLILPRRASPRNRVKKGSVAIGSEQCGIYVEDSPGGWHIIGHTEQSDFSSLKAGDKVVFKPFSQEKLC